jgi:hypothetical protein
MARYRSYRREDDMKDPGRSRFDLSDSERIVWDVADMDEIGVSAKADPLSPNAWSTSGVALSIQWSVDGFNFHAFGTAETITAGGGGNETVDVSSAKYVGIVPAATSTTSVYVNVFGTAKTTRTT